MTSARPTLDECFLRMAEGMAARATCRRRAVGCVLIDADGRVVATGYNGVPAGWPHCLDAPCPGADAAPGERLDACEAIHAEQNALLRCDAQRVHAAYVTASPCAHCVKLFLNTRCQRIVFRDEYPHAKAREWWERDGRSWEKRDV